MLRIGICDDSADARESLRFQLEKVMLEGSEEVVYEFSSGESAVRWLFKHPGEIDLLFMDVEMDGMTGMEAAKKLREFNSEIILVFVTGYSDYVFDGYLVNAMDYLMKPVNAERLCELLKRVRKQVYQDASKCYLFKNGDGMFRMPVSKIDYLYSDKRKVILVSGEKEYDFYGKLDEVSEQLPDFVRIHQRYLVNPRQVEHIGTNHVEIRGTKLPVSRAMKDEAGSRLAKSLLGEMDR